MSLLPPSEPAGVSKLSLAQQVDAFERRVIERSLAEAGGRISVVMEQLDIPRRTLSEKMARFGLDRRRFLDPNRQNLADESASTGG
jgi:two-component system C4-dicarboxylate transport response regulator DctD